MADNSTVEAIKTAYGNVVMQLYNVYLSSESDPNGPTRFLNGLTLAQQVRDSCIQLSNQTSSP